MRIINFMADNFKRLKAIEIEPSGDMVVIAGNNGQGKSSILDAIWVALAGKAVAPPKPVRKGEEKCTIVVQLGDHGKTELTISRTFTDKEGKITDTVKVESAEGLRYPRPQEVLDELMGSIGFDPFAFVNMKSDRQAQTLMELVPLTVDLDDMAALDTSDYEKRREINREVQALDGQIAGIPMIKDLPKDAPDRQTLLDKLGNAANHNTAINQQQGEWQREDQEIAALDRRIAEIQGQIESLQQHEQRVREERAALHMKVGDRAALPEPIDTDAIREDLRTADEVMARIDSQRRRDDLVKQRDAKQAESDKLTKAMTDRDTARKAALTQAQMPIEGLGFGVDEKGRPIVTLDGVPFEQGSFAQKLRAAVAIAMAANPTLRVLRVENAAMLDDQGMSLLREMATANDYQLWVEVVRPDEGVGIIIEDGQIVVPTDPTPAKKAAPKKASKSATDKPEGAML